MTEVGVKAAKLMTIEGGELINLYFMKKAWVFVFENKFTVESYGGWRILLNRNGGKTLLGNRDLEGLKNPYKEIMKYILGFELAAINFNGLSDTVQLQLLDEKNRISLDLFSNSAECANWRFIGEDFEDTDKVNILEKL